MFVKFPDDVIKKWASDNIFKALKWGMCPLCGEAVDHHEDCPAKYFNEKYRLEESFVQWLASGERGTASNYLAQTITGIKCGVLGDHENSMMGMVEELRKCRLLFEMCPSIFAKFKTMKHEYFGWQNLANKWEELCAVMDEEIPNWREKVFSTQNGPRADKTEAAIQAIRRNGSLTDAKQVESAIDFRIFQIRRDMPDEESRLLSFKSLERLVPDGSKIVNRNWYAQVYEGKLSLDQIEIDDTYQILEKIFHVFNVSHPTGFIGHSLSVGDIVEIGSNFYYCDPIGFLKLEDFF